MESKARILNVFPSKGKFILQLEIEPRDVTALLEKDLRLTLKQWHERRSLNANAYFHVLVGKIAEAVGQSNAYIKNDLIRKYGQYEYIDDKILVYITNAPPEYMYEREEVHTALHSTKVVSGVNQYTYLILRGTHSYNTQEMSRLIDGAVNEARELGIETMSPAELERMKATWNPSLSTEKKDSVISA